MVTSLLFFADEHLRQHSVRRLLSPHDVHFTALQTRDPAIVMAAEQAGAIILTSDTWFHVELRQDPYYVQKRLARQKGGAQYTRAGVWIVAGEWGSAREQIATWLPVVEAVATVQGARVPGRRTVVCIGDKNTVQIDL